MIAVSSVIYRLFANVVRQIVTRWSLDNGKVSDAQFGFYPGRSTTHPMFILRHLIRHCHFRRGR